MAGVSEVINLNAVDGLSVGTRDCLRLVAGYSDSKAVRQLLQVFCDIMTGKDLEAGDFSGPMQLHVYIVDEGKSLSEFGFGDGTYKLDALTPKLRQDLGFNRLTLAANKMKLLEYQGDHAMRDLVLEANELFVILRSTRLKRDVESGEYRENSAVAEVISLFVTGEGYGRFDAIYKMIINKSVYSGAVEWDDAKQMLAFLRATDEELAFMDELN